MLRYECYDAGAGDAGVGSSRIVRGGAGVVEAAEVTVEAAGPTARSALISVAGTVERASPSTETDADLDSAAAALRSWVVGWTHRFDPHDSRRTLELNPAAVRRLVEAVIDVLLERRPAEQIKRLVTREVFALLTAVTQRRAATRFAARSMVRSIQLHAPGPDAVESTVLVQDGPRVRAVALRFERISHQGFGRVNGGNTPGGGNAQGVGSTYGGSSSIQGGGNTQGVGSTYGGGSSVQGGGNAQGRLEWRCTALQFA